MLYKKERKILILIIGVIIILISSLLFYLNNDSKDVETILLTTTQTTSKEPEMIFVDVKGSVKKPGVYKFEENDRVLDAIEKAGGLTKKANTDNINLSQKLVNEMVIYVYSDSEIKNGNNLIDCSTVCETNVIEINNCIENSSNSDLININTATLDELLNLSGIGESKAENIIKYREENGNFKSIDEIKNISGIGDALFEKIKDKITI